MTIGAAARAARWAYARRAAGAVPAAAPRVESQSSPAPNRSGERRSAAPPGEGRGAARKPLTGVSWWGPVLACLLLALLSLLGPSAPTYDPWAWIIWGREITQGELATTHGPSWKPLPVIFTTPFALLGDDAAPQAWLVVARAGGLMAIYLAYRLAARIAGRWAGVVAAGALLLSEDFVRHFARGNSEGLLVALCLAAVHQHLDQRRTAAFLLGFGAALLRPEIWPFLGLYGLWLAARDPGRRLMVAGAFALIVVLWLVPEYVGSGDLLRAAERARQPNPDSAAHAASPFLEVHRRAAGLLAAPVWAGALVALVMAGLAGGRRRGARLVMALAAAAVTLMVGVGLMTEAGFAGNLRYVALPAALVCVLAGVGWVWLVRGAGERLNPSLKPAAVVAVALLSAPFAVAAGASFNDSLSMLSEEAAVYRELDRVLAAAGGRTAVERCGRVITGPYEVQVVAWKLHRHGAEVALDGPPPGTVVALRDTPPAADRRFEPVAETSEWVVRRACES